LRDFMARFNAPWHREAAETIEKPEQWYAAAFHWCRRAEHDPRDQAAWQNLEAACARLGNWQLTFQACQRLLERDPTQPGVYFRRARLRAHFLQFHRATADQLAGLALLPRAKAP
jgi:hypothetical protein